MAVSHGRWIHSADEKNALYILFSASSNATSLNLTSVLVTSSGTQNARVGGMGAYGGTHSTHRVASTAPTAPTAMGRTGTMRFVRGVLAEHTETERPASPQVMVVHGRSAIRDPAHVPKTCIRGKEHTHIREYS